MNSCTLIDQLVDESMLDITVNFQKHSDRPCNNCQYVNGTLVEAHHDLQEWAIGYFDQTSKLDANKH